MLQKFWQSNQYWFNSNKSSKLLSVQYSIWSWSVRLPFTYYSFQKRESAIIKHRVAKTLKLFQFRSEILKHNFNYNDLRTFKETVFNVFNKYVPIKRKYVRANDAPFMTKELHKTIMKRSGLRNKFLKDRTENNQKTFKRQRNVCKKLLRTTKKSYCSNLDIKKLQITKLSGKE